jgi:sugar/nucleoside kinase (ribokinase family)
VTARPVVVVGDVGLDVLVRPRAAVVPGGDTPSDIRVVPGGAGGNTAAWLASVGVPVALVSRVGDDDAGAAARRRLESDGVVCRLVVDPERPTCTVVVLLEDDERTMLPDRGGNAALAPSDLDLAVAAAALGATGIPHLHLSGFVLLDPRSRPAGLAALESARSLGWTTSVDPQAANHVSRVGAEAFLGWAEGVDLLLPNEIEAQALGGDEVMLRAARAAAVSMGAGGARWVTSAHTWRAPAPEVVAGDRTGCGDAFDAGVLAAWLNGADEESALIRGVELGSLAAGRVGARP